jgi:diaminopimelate epimerase
VQYVKGHGTGNDFIVLPDPDGDLELGPAVVRALCDRRFGVGADGMLRVVLAAAAPEAAGLAGTVRWFMDYRNADGSLAETCGNGIRVFARYLVDAGYAPPGTLAVATRAGVRHVVVPAAGDITVDMGPPEIAEGPAVPVTVAGRTYQAIAVSMGNPHAVCFADDLGPAGLAALDLGRTPTFPADVFPAGVNVEVVVDRPAGRSDGRAAGRVAMRVYERGVGETASCGTGACAAGVASAARRGVEPPTEVAVDLSGGRLMIRWEPSTVLLRGPAVLVCDGVLRDDWLAGAVADAS